MLDFKEILTAFKAKRNPTKLQEVLAEKRLRICENCEFLKTGDNTVKYCGQCGCIIKYKIFSYKEGACPEGKWDHVDAQETTRAALKVFKNPNASLI